MYSIYSYYTYYHKYLILTRVFENIKLRTLLLIKIIFNYKNWNTGAVGGVESCDKDQPTETALREMREEIGVELSDSVKLYPLDVRHYGYGMTRLFFCFLDSKNDIVVDNKEIIDYKWENLNKVMNNDMRGTSKDSWNAVVEFIINH
jgi:hypothetical protein